LVEHWIEKYQLLWFVKPNESIGSYEFIF